MKIKWLRECDSTNDELVGYSRSKAKLNLFDVYCLAADKQNKGKGRRQKYWHSSNENNIYCSVCITVNRDATMLGIYSLASALSILECLKKIKPTAYLTCKWPNDIFCDEKKIAGVLLEIGKSTDDFFDLIVGFGINLYPAGFQGGNSLFDNLPNTAHEINKKKQWTSEIAHAIYSKIKGLAGNKERYLINRHENKKILESSWLINDLYYKKSIRVKCGSKILEGIHQGIDSLGRLKLATTEGEHTFSSGEVTLII